MVDEQPEQIVEALIKEYEDVLNGMGCLPCVYDIVIDKNMPPVQNRPRKVAYALKEDFEKKIGELEIQGVIAKVETQAAWISNCIAVRKPNGSVRVCIDPSDLNKALQINHYTLPTIDEVLPTLKDAKIFSLVDAKDGFLQLKLSEQSSYLTTFWTLVENSGGSHAIWDLIKSRGISATVTGSPRWTRRDLHSSG